VSRIVALLIFVTAAGGRASGQPPSVAVGPQYDSTRVYLRAADYDAFVGSFLATFGGQASARLTANITPGVGLER
jgi:hypothetical protein